MPAPRRAILSDITEFELSDKNKLTVGKDGRLRPLSPVTSKEDSSVMVEKESPVKLETTSQVEEVTSHNEANFTNEVVEQAPLETEEKTLPEPNADTAIVQPMSEIEKPKPNRSGRFRKKESAGSV